MHRNMSDLEYDRDVAMEEPQPYLQYQRPPPPRKIDFIGLDLPDIADPMYKSKPEQDLDVRYEVKEENEFHETRALFIGNLRRPINAAHFQLYLRDLAREEGSFIIERAWLSRARTHAIVLVSSEHGAVYIRSKLLNTVYPSKEEEKRLKLEFEEKEIERFEEQKRLYEQELGRLNEKEREALPPPLEPREYVTERIPLYVEYIPVKAINQWTFEEDRGPRDGKWKLEFEHRDGDTVASHTLLNSDYIPRYVPTRRGPPRRYNDRPYNAPPRRADSYVPNGTNRRTDTYIPSRDRNRSRSPSRSPRRY